MKKLNCLFFILMIFPVIFFSSCKEDPTAPSGTNPELVVNAGIGKTVLITETVSLEGSAINTEAASAYTYQWSIVSVPSGSVITSASISNSTSLVDASFTPDKPGSYNVKLSISDGTASAEASAVIKAVGFVIGINDNNNAKAAFFHNGAFTPLNEPVENNGFNIDFVRLKNGSVYSAGKVDTSGETTYQPVYWKDNISTVVAQPSFKAATSRTGMFEVASDGKVHIIVNSNNSAPIEYAYWIENAGYFVPDDNTVSAPAPWDSYFITAIDEVNGSIYQLGTGFSEPSANGYFLLHNLDEIIHNGSFELDPQNPESFIPQGTFIIPASPESASKIVIYGQKPEINAPYKAGYIINEESWTDLPGGMHIQIADENIRYMASKDDYILEVQGDPTIYSAFIDGVSYELEEPHAAEADVNIYNLELTYIEKIDGSIFIGGGYSFNNDNNNIYYHVAAIWRDGNLVFEAYDDINDEYLYNYAELAWEAFDFE